MNAVWKRKPSELHGQLFILSSYLVFSTKVFGSKSKVCDLNISNNNKALIPFQNVTSIINMEEKKKTRLLLKVEAKDVYLFEVLNLKVSK